MNNVEYGDALIRLGELIKDKNSKMVDIVAASLDCGLIYTFGLTPKPEASVEFNANEPVKEEI